MGKVVLECCGRHASHEPRCLTLRTRSGGGCVSVSGMLPEEVLQLMLDHHIPLDARFTTDPDLGAVLAWGDGHRLTGDYLRK